MKKVLFGLILLVILPTVSSCDSAERRKKNAEEIIEKHLFESLDNYKSYEKVSTTVDTLQDLWMVNDELLALADSLQTEYYQYKSIDNELIELNGQLEYNQNSAVNSLFSGSSNSLLNYLNYSSKYENCKSKIAKTKKLLQEQTEKIDEIETRIYKLNKALPNPKKPYWLVTHKYRYSDSGENTRIFTMYFIFDPKVKEILYSWDDGQLGILHMIDDMNAVIESKSTEGKTVEPVDSI